MPSPSRRTRRTYFFIGALKVMRPTALSPPDALPTLTAQFFRLVLVVPHVPAPLPEPTFPVTTLKDVRFRRPAAVIVAYGGMPLTRQPDWPFAFARHSTRYTVSPALKPLPVTWTTSPLRRFFAGETTTFGPPTADALEMFTTPLARPVIPTSAKLSTVRSPFVDMFFLPGCPSSPASPWLRHSKRNGNNREAADVVPSNAS